MITKFFKAIPTPQTSGSSPPTPSSSPSPTIHDNINPSARLNKEKMLNLNLEPDPAERKQISEYPPNLRDQFNTSYSGWLEYSVKVDAAFCLCCYLFKNEHGGHGKVGDSLTKSGFRAWNKAIERFNAYIGEAIPTPQTYGSSPPTPSSSPSPTIHDNINPSARLNKEKMLNLNLELDPAERKQISEFPKRDFGGFMRQFNLEWFNTSYSRWLEYSVKVDAAFCLCCYLFKNEHGGHEKVGDSFTNSDRDDEVNKVVLQSAPKNNMMIAPNIQKEIVNACAKEIMKAIVEDLNGDYFGILVDESKDVSHKEQMALVLRYVNKEGKLIERFLSIVHVKKTTSSSLQKAIYDFLLVHSLSPSQIRGQGYDGASNIQGEINGLKTLILKDNPSAYCIHCFAGADLVLWIRVQLNS
ncbi:uncharacterized protein [Nicotiana sylvestris]|uniref:uncharacterized protein n=1 Tax=Nicotiana sylvestris TaxID=4096 RepID=UPI00388C900E